MHPRIWGRDMWRSIHYIALGYPVHNPSVDIKQSYISFFSVLGSVLPCAKCAQHYNRHLTSYPLEPSLTGRAELFRWTVDLHNGVNTSLGRKTWTYEQAYEVYADRRAPQNTDSIYGQEHLTQIAVKTAILIVSSMAVAAVIMWWVRVRRRRLSRHLT